MLSCLEVAQIGDELPQVVVDGRLQLVFNHDDAAVLVLGLDVGGKRPGCGFNLNERERATELFDQSFEIV